MDPNKEKWSHLAEEYVVSLFPNSGIISGLTSGVKLYAGRNLKFFAQRYENNSCQYLMKKSDWEQTSLPWAEKLLAKPAEFKKVKREIDNRLKALLIFANQVNKTKLKNKKNSELFALFNKFAGLNYRAYAWGLALVLLDFQETTYISDALTKYLKNELAAKDYSEYFTALTTMPKRTEARQEELDLLKIVSKIKKNKKLVALLCNNVEREIPGWLLKLNKNIYQLIVRHAKRYNYITYVYEGPPLEIPDFILMIKEFIVRDKNPDKKIKEILQSEKDLMKKRADYQNKLKPSAYYKKLIKLAQEISFVKFYRREQQSHAYCLLEGLLREISRRLNISVKQLRFLTSEELEAYLVHGHEVNIEKINKRMKLCVLACENGGKIKLLEAKAAQKFIKNIEVEKIDYDVKELKGQTACIGKVKGRVKIINLPEDMEKIKDGEILASFATNPNLMPAIRKASAIITDEGGLTSHAAIVSRELNIPCIVGLKIITKILHDGDLVEVDANQGIVKIIK